MPINQNKAVIFLQTFYAGSYKREMKRGLNYSNSFVVFLNCVNYREIYSRGGVNVGKGRATIMWNVPVPTTREFAGIFYPDSKQTFAATEYIAA